MPDSRTLRLTLAYDGTDFAGWQIQPGKRTVQGVLEEAVGRLAGCRIPIVGASRTDSGVHAHGQVASLRWSGPVPPARLTEALRGLLPEDLVCLDCASAPADFNAREDCRRKTYTYLVHLSRLPDPLVRRFAAHVPYALDTAVLVAAAALLEGRIDLSAFAPYEAIGRLGARGGARVISSARWELLGHRARFSITGDGFLRHSIRCMVGAMIEAARGRVSLEAIRSAIQSGDRTRLPVPTMPACGLCLESVEY